MFNLDVDTRPRDEFRVVQMTPAGGLGEWVQGPDPERGDYNSFADFRDPDGNTLVLPERGRS